IHADLSTPTTDKNDIWSMLANETWVIGNTSLNQFSFLLNRYVDVIDTINDVPPIRTLTFPSLAVGKVGGFDQTFRQTKVQLKDDFTQQLGKHSVKFGGEFALYPQLSVITDITFWGSVGFFDDPSTIANNTNGRY